MKRFVTLFLLIALAVPTLTGCYHNQIIVQENYNSSATAPDWESSFQMYLLFGLIPLGDNPVDLTSACPQGAGIVSVRQSFVNGLLNSVIGAILSFQDVEVYCANAAAQNELDTDELASN